MIGLSWLKPLPLVGCVLLLSGCALGSVNMGGLDDTQRMVVVRQPRSISIVTPNPGKSISQLDKVRIKQFITGYMRVENGGPFIVSAPRIREGKSPSEASIKLVYNAVMAAGVPIENIEARSFWAADLSVFRMGYYVARIEVPGCEHNIASVNMASTRSNDVYPTFGCAVSSSIAALLDPEHVANPAAPESPDADRVGVGIDRYRKGESNEIEDVEILSGGN